MREDIQSVLYSPETLAERCGRWVKGFPRTMQEKIRFWSVCSKARSYS